MALTGVSSKVKIHYKSHPKSLGELGGSLQCKEDILLNNILLCCLYIAGFCWHLGPQQIKNCEICKGGKPLNQFQVTGF